MEDRRLDILLTGCSRSGTTLVANLLTHGPNWCMVEPLSNELTVKDRVRIQAESFNLKMRDLKLQELPHRVNNLTRWGIKEIMPDRREIVMKMYNPKIVVICVRRMQDMAISYLNFEEGKEDCVEYFYKISTLLLAFINGVAQCGTQIIYIQYEQLLNSRYLMEKSMELGWPLSGDPDQWLRMYNRGDEIRGSIKMRQHAITEETYQVAEKTSEACQFYQKLFGYIDRLPGEKI